MRKSIDMLKRERELWSLDITNIAGVDEAGRGCLAGPVVAAAVIFPENLDIEEVNDSKQLTAKERERVYSIILRHCLAWSVQAASPRIIDRRNILQATLLAMSRSLGRLPVKPGYILIDGNRCPEELPVPSEYIIGGDGKSRTIAAASILAKVTRDRLMINLDRIYPEYHFAMHKGYGTEYHRKILEQIGPTPHHRFSFKPVSQLRLKFDEY